MIFAFTRRLAQSLFVVFGVSLLAFLLTDLAPGDYFQEMKLNPQISPKTVAALRAEHGLDRPVAFRYALWLRSLARGEFGYSFTYNCPVWPLLSTRGWNTLVLTVTALFFSWIIAVPTGVLAAVGAGRWLDRSSAVCTSFLLSTPDVVIGLVLLAFALHSRWFPTGGMRDAGQVETSMFAAGRDLARHLILPIVALTAGTTPLLFRHVRSATLDVLDSSFIVAARGHGISRNRILFRHVLPVAANPLISLFGVSIGTLLGGSLLIEVIMGWPGVGPLLLHAVLERDAHVVIAATMFSTLFLTIGNLLADALLYVADPRIREE